LKRCKGLNITFVEGSGELQTGIRYELSSGGHSKFHQVFWIELEGKKVFFGGDELPEPEQLIRKFVAKYDYDGHRSAELRIQYGKKAAAEGDICLFYHARATAIGTVNYQDEVFTVTAV
jgi:glyoxylase-like metal-dependent hydrolase (beta-lactamase superfamily II)